MLVADGFDAAKLAELRASVKTENAAITVVAPKVGGAKDNAGKSGAPSVLFDAVVLLPSKASADEVMDNAGAIDFVRHAFGHCKVLGHPPEAQSLLNVLA